MGEPQTPGISAGVAVYGLEACVKVRAPCRARDEGAPAVAPLEDVQQPAERRNESGGEVDVFVPPQLAEPPVVVVVETLAIGMEAFLFKYTLEYGNDLLEDFNGHLVLQARDDKHKDVEIVFTVDDEVKVILD